MQLQVVALPETALETPMFLFYCGFLSASSSVPACWRSMFFSALLRGRILQVDLWLLQMVLPDSLAGHKILGWKSSLKTLKPQLALLSRSLVPFYFWAFVCDCFFFGHSSGLFFILMPWSVMTMCCILGLLSRHVAGHLVGCMTLEQDSVKYDPWSYFDQGLIGMLHAHLFVYCMATFIFQWQKYN